MAHPKQKKQPPTGSGNKKSKKKRHLTSVGSPADVQGLDTTVEDLTLNGIGIRAFVGDAITDSKVGLTVEGASTLSLDIEDPKLELIQSGLFSNVVDLDLDGLGFRLVKVTKSGTKITVTFEDLPIARLRKFTGFKKVLRSKHTRAEFVQMLVRQAKSPTIDFYSPELHKIEPIATKKGAKAVAATRTNQKQPGLSTGSHVTVKGVKASSTQLRILNEVLDTGVSQKRPRKLLIMAVMTMTQESDIAILHQAGGYGPFSQLKNGAWPASGDPSKDAGASNGFYAAAAREYKSDPNGDLGALIIKVQNPLDQSPQPYDQWKAESTKTVDAYFGAGATSAAAATQQLKGAKLKVDKKYAFTRGNKESSWDCIKRLADEVKWRVFCVGGTIYFISDTELMKTSPTLDLSPGAPGVDDIDFDYDVGKPLSEATITAHAPAWGAPPGDVITLSGYGPADGRWLITDIDGSLHTDHATITIKSPTSPLGEPAGSQSTSKKGKGSTGGTSADVDAKTAKGIARIHVLNSQHPPYRLGGGHGAFSDHPSTLDCSGAVSDVLHAMGLLNSPEASGPLESFGAAGKGKIWTIYANADHTFLSVVIGGHLMYWGTSVGDSGAGGLGFHPAPSAGYLSSFTARHPAGL